MFRNRQNSQKPSDELYKDFKSSFSQLSQPNISPSTVSAAPQGASSLADALDVPLGPRAVEQHQAHETLKDADATPRGSNGPWNFGTSGLTPSLMDPSHHNFSMFADNMPGYYTPGGSSSLYHNQAGDLHTPGFGMGLGTPLSMPTSEGALPAGQHGAPFPGFQGNMPANMQQPPFQNVNPFHMHHQQQQPQQSFPPQHFSHQNAFDVMDGQVDPSDGMDMDMQLSHPPPQRRHTQQAHHHSPDLLMHPQSLRSAMGHAAPHPNGERLVKDASCHISRPLMRSSFRYHVTLNAPTAMIKHADEVPVTYLNKGQVYTLNVVDTHSQQSTVPLRFRTFVRISFEDDQQRAKPAACWQLWKEGRGTNEAHQRGGRLQAVEYVESGQLTGAEDPSKPRIELESASFDGFCVTWSPPAGTAECPISVRFNFLSTDFSHSKGVKGIPVRLCAKTEAIPAFAPAPSHDPTAETCYCKVKLFRDHGAERKLSNDVAHVKKTIDKLNQQIAQIESGMRDLGKRKRGNAKSGEERPGKVPKHRRTWSLSSVTSTGARGSAEEDLHIKLMALQDMFTSTRPASVLYLRGADQDDPDLYPVKLTGEIAELVQTESLEEASNWEQQSQEESALSPESSHDSLSGSRRDSTLQQPTPFESTTRASSSEWRNKTQTATSDLQPTQPKQLASPPDNNPVKIQTMTPSGNLSGWIEALGVDSTYQPPSEPVVKPVACFYMQPHMSSRSSSDRYYRAVYLTKRTLKDFVNAMAAKCEIEPTTVMQTTRITPQGLEVLFDDDCVRELPEGQDMKVEIIETTSDRPAKTRREWDAGPTDVQCDGELPTTENLSTSGFELKLMF